MLKIICMWKKTLEHRCYIFLSSSEDSLYLSCKWRIYFYLQIPSSCTEVLSVLFVEAERTPKPVCRGSGWRGQLRQRVHQTYIRPHRLIAKELLRSTVCSTVHCYFFFLLHMTFVIQWVTLYVNLVIPEIAIIKDAETSRCTGGLDIT